MKKFIQSFAVVLVLSVGEVFANDNAFQMAMNFDNGSDQLKTFFEKQKGKAIEVRIYDQKGLLLQKKPTGTRR